MDQTIRCLLDGLPSKPFRSKLEPHRELIRELRRKRHSYQEIAQFFASQLHIHVAPSTIHNFLKVRSLLREPRAIPATVPQPPVDQTPSTIPARTKRRRRRQRPNHAMLLRSVRVLLRFLRNTH